LAGKGDVVLKLDPHGWFLSSGVCWKDSTLDISRKSLLNGGKVEGKFLGRLETRIHELERRFITSKVMVERTV
jgi:hypothetical protein